MSKSLISFSSIFRISGLLLLSTPLAVALLAVQREALHPPAARLNDVELNRVEELILESAPIDTRVPTRTRVALTAEEVNLLLRYALQLDRTRSLWSAEVELDKKLSVQTSYILSSDLSLYLNMTADFTVSQQQLSLSGLRLGNIQFPGELLQLTENRLRGAMQNPANTLRDVSTFINNIESISLDSQQITVDMLWDPQLIARLSDQTQQLLMSEADREGIRDYYEFIATVINATPLDVRALSLNSLLVPLMQLAQERSASADPVAENQALWIALATYVNEEDISSVLGVDGDSLLRPGRFIEVRLRRRQDLALHVSSMAALTVRTGAGLAATLSNTKEAYDARYRTGFSFSDMAANSVGVRLAGLAIHSEASARALQSRLGRVQSEEEYMLDIGSNRDGLSESAFAEQFQDRMSDEYRLHMEEIERRIDQLPVFRDLARFSK